MTDITSELPPPESEQPTSSTPTVPEGYQLVAGTEDADVLELDAGKYVAALGDGDDLLRYSGDWSSESSIIAYGEAGNDHIDIKRASTATVDGGAGDDQVWTDLRGTGQVEGGDGIDTFRFMGWGQVHIDLEAGIAYRVGGDTSWTLSGIENIEGGWAGDVVIGNAADNVLSGGSTLEGRAGNDTLSSYDPATMDGGDGDDSLTALGAASVLIGGEGADSITGGYGDDTITGGAGDDTLQGGSGADLFRVETGSGIDRIVGFVQGQDRLRINVDFAALNVATAEDLLARSTVVDGRTVLDLGNGDQVVFDQPLMLTADDLVLVGISGGPVNLVGGAGDDLLNGTGQNDTLAGGDGSDTLVGGAGGDLLDGGEGQDTILYAGADGTMVRLGTGGQDGQGTYGDAQGDVLRGIEHVTSTGGSIDVRGNEAGNRLSGGAGNDTLDGGSGDDTLLGGDGDDYIHQGDGLDAIDGGAGFDTLAFNAYYASTSSPILTNPFGVVVSMAEGRFRYANQADWSAETFAGIERIDGTVGNDTVTGTAGNDTIAGRGGIDSIDGGAGADELRLDAGLAAGGLGNDTIRGSQFQFRGGLTANGGDGNDSILLDTVRSVSVDGGLGDDRIEFTRSAASGVTAAASGGAGNDRFRFSDVSDAQADGGTGNDTIIVTMDSRVVATGGDGADTFNFSIANSGSRVGRLEIVDYDKAEGDVLRINRDLVSGSSSVEPTAQHLADRTTVTELGLQIDLHGGSQILLRDVWSLEQANINYSSWVY